MFKDIKFDQVVSEDIEVSSLEETLSDDTLPSTKMFCPNSKRPYLHSNAAIKNALFEV